MQDMRNGEDNGPPFRIAVGYQTFYSKDIIKPGASMEGIHAEQGFRELKQLIVQNLSLDCHQYKDGYLKRRLAVRMRAREVGDYRAYADLLRSDPLEYDELLDDLTINVTHFFRDEAVFRALENEVLPLLIYNKVMRGESSIRIWSAGCSSGEEPYSMAILLKELLGEEFDKFSVTIVASDIDEGVLEIAKGGQYSSRQVAHVPPQYLARHFTLNDDMYKISPSIMDMVRFRNIDLFTATAGSHFDMILCRNVVIYFTREMQEKLYIKFHRSLRPGGYLVMGNTETLAGEAATLFVPTHSRERIYQKEERSYP